jgi:hypothetical protein
MSQGYRLGKAKVKIVLKTHTEFFLVALKTLFVREKKIFAGRDCPGDIDRFLGALCFSFVAS